MTTSFLKEIKKATNNILTPEEILKQSLAPSEYGDVQTYLSNYRQDAQANDLQRLERDRDQREKYHPMNMLYNLRKEIDVSDKGAFNFDAILGMWRLKTTKRGLIGRITQVEKLELLKDPELYAKVAAKDTAKEQEEVLIDYLNLPGQEFPDFELCVNFFGDTHYSPESIDKLAEELEWMTESDYAMWRMMAKVSFEPTVSELIKTYKSRHPRSQPFSITCCERSELLCKSHPLISVHKQFAFI